ncbi:MAG: chemotaxis protein CheA [Planctomycetes bacterium]|nr:chemotaxis protein CheA [Planctomycetota bacterium]
MDPRDREWRASIADFRAEADELIARIDADLTALDDPAAPGSPRRAMGLLHTLKGNAAFIGFEAVQALAHRMEDLLLALDACGPVDRRPAIDLLLASLDVLRRLCSDARPDAGTAGVQPLLDRLEREVQPRFPAGEGRASAPASDSQDEAGARPRDESGAASPGRGESDLEPRIHVQASRLDALVDLVGELMIARNRFLAASAEGTIPLRLIPAVEELDRIAADLHGAVMRTRRVRIDPLVSRMRRIARDVGGRLGKRIRFQATGGDTEADRSVVEAITDPLLHLVRNACDHGIEPPEERRRCAKPEEGTVSFSATHDAHQIRIVIEDDGRGLDFERIAGVAADRGLIRREEAGRLSPREILEIILRPGFSTAGTVTEVSGRGIGLDVVACALAAIGGTVDVESEAARGTRFIIRIPRKLVISKSLIVRGGDDVFAIPIDGILEIVQVPPVAIAPAGEGRRLERRGRSVPVIDIAEVFAECPARAPAAGGASRAVVILESGSDRLGLIVDALVGQEEIVVKPLGPHVPRMGGISGGAILGDGRVALVLHAARILRDHHARVEARQEGQGEGGDPEDPIGRGSSSDSAQGPPAGPSAAIPV